MFRKLFGLFGQKSPVADVPPLQPSAPKVEGPLIHIHEDDWGMRNLHPEVAREHAEADIAAAAEAGRQNFDGVGWTDVYAIKPPEVSFQDVGLKVEAVVAALEPLLPRVNRFHATISSYLGKDDSDRDPYGSYEDDAICFGFDPRCFIKIDPAGDLVGAIWFQAEREAGPEMQALIKGLLAINALTPCIVADYWADASGPLSDSDFSDRYFAFLTEREG